MDIWHAATVINNNIWNDPQDLFSSAALGAPQPSGWSKSSGLALEMTEQYGRLIMVTDTIPTLRTLSRLHRFLEFTLELKRSYARPWKSVHSRKKERKKETRTRVQVGKPFKTERKKKIKCGSDRGNDCLFLSLSLKHRLLYTASTFSYDFSAANAVAL